MPHALPIMPSASDLSVDWSAFKEDQHVDILTGPLDYLLP